MRCEIAYLSNKWSPASQDGIGFRISNEINDFVRSRMSIVAISCGMALNCFQPVFVTPAPSSNEQNRFLLTRARMDKEPIKGLTKSWNLDAQKTKVESQKAYWMFCWVIL